MLNWYYHSLIWQPAGSLGAHTGTGSMLVFAITVLVCAEVLESCVEAAKPVMARTTTKARTMFFMIGLPLKLYVFLKISLDKPDKTTLGWKRI